MKKTKKKRENIFEKEIRKSNFDNEMNIRYAIHSDTLKFSKGERHAINIRSDYFSKFVSFVWKRPRDMTHFAYFSIECGLSEANCKQRYSLHRVLSDGIWPCLRFVYQRLIMRLRKNPRKNESCGWSVFFFANCPSIELQFLRSKGQRTFVHRASQANLPLHPQIFRSRLSVFIVIACFRRCSNYNLGNCFKLKIRF